MNEHDLRSAASVIQRMKETLGIRSDRHLATMLGVSPRAVSAWRTRNAVPYQECVEVAVNTATPLDWLILGTSRENGRNASSPRIDYELLRRVVQAVERNYLRIYGEASSKMGRDKADQICGTYRWWMSNLEQVLATGKFNRSEAMALLESLASDRDKLASPSQD